MSNVVRLRLRDVRGKVSDVMALLWLIVSSIWIWHAIIINDTVFLMLGVAVLAVNLAYYLLPLVKVEVREDGIKIGYSFYRWNELESCETNGYVVFKTRKGETFRIPTNVLK